jgi:hypothetical protein
MKSVEGRRERTVVGAWEGAVEGAVEGRACEHGAPLDPEKDTHLSQSIVLHVLVEIGNSTYRGEAHWSGRAGDLRGSNARYHSR